MADSPVIAALKQTLGGLSSDTQIRIQVGTDGSVFQVSAAELASALGVTLTATTAAPTTTASSSATSMTRKVQVTSDFLRIRAQPTTSAAEVAQIKKGEVAEVLTTTPVKADNYTWLRLADGRGFIASEFTAPFDPAQASTTGTPTGPSFTTAPVALSWTLPFSATMRGVGASAGGWAPDDKQLDLIRKNNIQVVYICCYEPGKASRAIPAFRNAGVKQFILRAAVHEPVSTAARFIQITKPIVKEYADQLGTQDLMIAIHNEVNLVQEGWTRAWRDGSEFATWWTEVANAFRQSLPGARIGFPAMSPGGDVPNVRLAEPTFLQQAGTAIQAADWVGVHYYWAQPDGSDINPPVAQWRQWFGNKAIVGTEVGPTDANTTSVGAVQRAYEKFAAAGIPAMAWILNGAGAWQNAAWDIHDIYLI